MKIKLSELRKIIREVVDQEATVPGKWHPSKGEPVDPDDIDLMGTGGLGRPAPETDEDSVEESKERGLWANIRARRAAGKRPKRPGEKGYPKTLDIGEGDDEAEDQ
jgi:hypothetical protein